jgi:hypothetical protein
MGLLTHGLWGFDGLALGLLLIVVDVRCSHSERQHRTDPDFYSRNNIKPGHPYRASDFVRWPIT